MKNNKIMKNQHFFSQLKRSLSIIMKEILYQPFALAFDQHPDFHQH